MIRKGMLLLYDGGCLHFRDGLREIRGQAIDHLTFGSLIAVRFQHHQHHSLHRRARSAAIDRSTVRLFTRTTDCLNTSKVSTLPSAAHELAAFFLPSSWTTERYSTPPSTNDDCIYSSPIPFGDSLCLSLALFGILHAVSACSFVESNKLCSSFPTIWSSKHGNFQRRAHVGHIDVYCGIRPKECYLAGLL